MRLKNPIECGNTPGILRDEMPESCMSEAPAFTAYPKHLSIAKITHPKCTGVTPRKRLFRLLDSCRKNPVTWISAPAGSGKTSLVASYLDARKMSCLWYQVDGGDADIATFFYYMGLAVKKAVPRLRKPLPLFTPEYAAGVTVFSQRYFEELCSRLKPPFVIVFDNYQEIPIESNLHDIVNSGLSSVPEGIYVIVLSRTQPPSALIKLRAGGNISLIGWKDIRFTEQETKEVCRLKDKRRHSRETLAMLHKKTDGWAAGLVLMIESSKLRDIDCRSMDRLTPNEIFEYFATEIFQKAGRETQAFLLKTAFLPAMTARMAEALTNLKTAGQLLSGLKRINYFIVEHQKTDPVYNYHPLFREFLILKATETFTCDQILETKLLAASVLMESGLMEDAAALLLDARDWKEFTHFALKHAPTLMAQGRSKTLAEWLVAIPEEIFDDAPWLLYWLGVCKLGSLPTDSRCHFEKAFHLFQRLEDMPGTFLAWSGAVDTFLFEFADFRPLDSWIGWLDTWVRQGVSFPTAELEARVAASMTGALVWRMPYHKDMKKWLNASLSLSGKYLNTDARMRACLDFELYFLWMGEVGECNMVVDEMKKMSMLRSASPLMLITAKAAEAALLSSYTDSYEQTDRLVMEGLEIGRKTGVHVMDLHLLAHGIQGALQAGNIALARYYLSEMEKVPECESVVGSSLFFHLSAWANLLLENAPRAVVHAKKSVQLAEKVGIPVPEALNRMVTALALCETGDFAEACRQLEKIKGIVLRIGSTNLEYMYQISRAHIAFAQQQNVPGLEALHRAMTLGRQKDFMTLVTFLRPDNMSRLCRKALEAGIEVDYVRKMVRRLKLQPDVPPAEAEHWPWEITISTLGNFEIRREGTLLEYPVKTPRKIISLLKAVIASGAKGAGEEQLADILWPEADADMAHQAFNTSLHRLRLMIGNDKAIQLREGRVRLDSRFCWVDALAFEALFDHAEKILKKSLPQSMEDDAERDGNRMMERAVMLYRGTFLEDIADSWVLSFRERLRSKFLRAVQRLGDNYEKEGRFDHAIEYYRKGLETDDLAEELYQRIMKCCHASGRGAEAIATYNRCRTLLASTLGIKPAPETDTLKEMILLSL
jgi:LuxR family transcriptional regulator, maltose regulon positive regulatory protein